MAGMVTKGVFRGERQYIDNWHTPPISNNVYLKLPIIQSSSFEYLIIVL